MRKVVLLFAVAAITLLAVGIYQNLAVNSVPNQLSGLNATNASNNASYVIDDYGNRVPIHPIPKRIVSLAPSNTEILFALGLGNKIVGVTDYCNYPPEAKNKTKIGGFSTINIEKIVSLNPDLVVAANGNGEENIKVLKRLGLRVVALNPKNLDDVMRDIRMLGKLTGTEKNATRLVKFMKCRINAVENATRNVARVSVVHILWNDPIWISGNDTFINDLIVRAGGVNAFSDISGWRVVSIEDLLERDPDVIIVSSGSGMGGEGNLLYKWVMDNLRDLKAVKDGRVYKIDADIISRPSYRLVYALEQIAEFLHPEISKAVEEGVGRCGMVCQGVCKSR